MTIEKTYKLTIKDTEFNLTEAEVSALYEACRKALNISYTGPIPSKPFDNPIAPMYPTWPVYPGTGTNPTWHTPYVTNKGTDTNVFTTTWSDKDMSTDVKSFSTNIFNKPLSSAQINFISDHMAIIEENDKWRSSVQQSLDKINAKKSYTTTSEGIKVG
jgi:hypothetical protein